MMHACDNCQEQWAGDVMDEIDNLIERLDYPLDDPRCIVPSGQCPECGALCYPEAQS